MTKLKNLHECLQDAGYTNLMLESTADYQSESKPRNNREVFVQSFQLDCALKRALDSICRENGATASSFLRECTRQLVSDYQSIEIGSKKWIQMYGQLEGRNV
jgi:hypothetical protein